jgi:predicted nucleic acid-binding protein
MRILVDTNILLRAVQRQKAGQAAIKAIKTLHRQGHTLCLAPQNIVEFWNVCTRPIDVNGLGLSVAGTERYVRRLRRMFTVVPDSLQSFESWLELVAKQEVIGASVHDARLAGLMKVNDIEGILTFNVSDFARYEGISAIDPNKVE